ncbi:flagellar hook-basal body protein [Romboutsia lituseburensis]|uniref:Flagellar hook protein FlgE n=1 Tax=Romboutsia lituseburensis DSM 797 TaxID=1121325 RepID=A0A1G9PAZ8_9FIRM|nr:flagellar hook-basal body complex protein [Romboutsia lituseburensis]CEH33310.1 Flagellar basal-body rod protein FlgG [Romboutsia lituseburensis]SDL95894.1 flagellar hook protein FlgE [Romboutsia lituseburensis DSM 797]
MLRSMYSGISGMKANQTKMDVVGNNVANVGTTAYKKTAARFSDALYQNAIYASQPGGGIGGVNPGQVGIGTKVSGIFKNMVQGAIQPTGRPTDLAIDGDGFFKVKLSENNYAYTRDGSFSLDADGKLVTSDGYYVVGVDDKPIEIPKAVDKDGNPVAPGTKDSKRVLQFNISKEGKISYLLEDGTKMPVLNDDGTIKVGTQQILNVAVFKNPEGLEALGGNLYKVSANSGDPIKTEVMGKINQGAIEMSNVDLSEEFTEMIVTTRAFQAASKVITTSDELLQEIVNLKR